MKKIYHLGTCNTCKRILSEIQPPADMILQDIKTDSITEEQLEEMKALAGSYEALFSRRSMKYRAWNLHEKELTEKDYRELILKEYTFLLRPVAIVGDEIFIGSAKKVTAALAEALKH